MPKSPHVTVQDGKIVFYSDFLYLDLHKTVKPREWVKTYPAGPDRDRPGAWLYPAEPAVAAGLSRAFQHIFDNDKNTFLDPKFVELAAAGKSSQQIKIDVKTVVQSMSKRCAIASPFIRVRSPYDPELIEIFKMIPNAQFVREPEPAWMYPAFPEIAARMHEILELYASFEYAEAKLSDDYLKLIPNPNAQRPPVRSKTEAWEHQTKAFWRAFDNPGFMLALDMGTGKSKVAVDLVVNRDDRRVLIVCPKAVINVWPKQFALHADQSYNPVILKLNGKETVERKADMLTKALQIMDGEARPLVVILNYDIVYREPLSDAILEAGFDCVIADESHKIKTPGAKASMFLARLGRRVKHRLALTGTPMPNAPEEIYAQYRFLDPTIFGPRYRGYMARDAYGHEVYKSGFLDDYATALDDYGKPRGYKNMRELNAKIYRIAERVKSTDVLDLPPTLHVEHYFDLSPKARRIIKDLDKKFEAEISDGKISVKMTATQILREAQITGGFAKMDDGETVQVDDGKQELLRELLDDLPPSEPVVVFCRFHEDLATVHKVARELLLVSLELSGDRNELDAWQDGHGTVLAVQIQSGGAGVDCTRAAHVFYYSIGYSNGDYEQSLKRADRPGQTRPVRFYHLLANDSVDIDIQAALVSKKNIVDAIMEMKTNRSFDIPMESENDEGTD